MNVRIGTGLLLSLLSCSPVASRAGSLDYTPLATALQHLASSFDGRVGICAKLHEQSACVRGDERLPLQSVMKLVVAVAALDAVDRSQWRLDDDVVVRPEDISVGVQPLARLVTAEGYRTSVEDLLARAVVASDSAATDVLFAWLGGTSTIQALLIRHNLSGIRIDRDERHLQSESFGLTWQAEYVDATVFRKAVEAVPDDRRQQAFDAQLSDPRDTATPAAMAALLADLTDGRLLSPPSTGHLLDVMRRTKIFPDRLKAGLPPGWIIGHKTGTGLDWQGVSAATNDVGILQSPNGVMLAGAGSPARDALRNERLC